MKQLLLITLLVFAAPVADAQPSKTYEVTYTIRTFEIPTDVRAEINSKLQSPDFEPDESFMNSWSLAGKQVDVFKTAFVAEWGEPFTHVDNHHGIAGMFDVQIEGTLSDVTRLKKMAPPPGGWVAISDFAVRISRENGSSESRSPEKVVLLGEKDQPEGGSTSGGAYYAKRYITVAPLP